MSSALLTLSIKCFDSKYENKTLMKERKAIISLWLARETIGKIIGARLLLIVDLIIIDAL